MNRDWRPNVVWAPYVVLSAVHVWALAVESDVAEPTKLTLMPLLGVPVIVAAARGRALGVAGLLLTALAFSFLGDGAGTLFPGGPELPLMLGFFGIAHIAYIVLFVRQGVGPWPRWLAVYAIWWIAMVATVGPHAGGLLIAVAVYGIVLAGTAATASRCGWIVTVGGVFFLISDSLLAFRIFVDSAPGWFGPAVMATYTVGQGLLVYGMLRHRPVERC